MHCPCIVVMARGFDRVVYFEALGAEDLVPGRGLVGLMVKVHCFFKIFLATHRHRTDRLGI